MCRCNRNTCCRPLRTCFNLPFCLNSSDTDFSVANMSIFLQINWYTMEGWKYFVEVDSLSFKNVLPFWYWDSVGCSWSKSYIQFCWFHVSTEPLDKASWLGTAWIGWLRWLSSPIVPRHILWLQPSTLSRFVTPWIWICQGISSFWSASSSRLEVTSKKLWQMLTSGEWPWLFCFLPLSSWSNLGCVDLWHKELEWLRSLLWGEILVLSELFSNSWYDLELCLFAGSITSDKLFKISNIGSNIVRATVDDLVEI